MVNRKRLKYKNKTRLIALGITSMAAILTFQQPKSTADTIHIVRDREVKIEALMDLGEVGMVNEEKEEQNYTIVKVVVTAYVPFDNKSGMCNDGDPTKTATGTRPTRGTLAADPKKLNYGTRIKIPGYGEGIVEDTGGALRRDKKNIRIDVYMDTYEEAMEWGVQELDVVIYEDKNN